MSDQVTTISLPLANGEAVEITIGIRPIDQGSPLDPPPYLREPTATEFIDIIRRLPSTRIAQLEKPTS